MPVVSRAAPPGSFYRYGYPYCTREQYRYGTRYLFRAFLRSVS